MLLDTVASSTGWGAVMDQHAGARSSHGVDRNGLHINLLELGAITRALLSIADVIPMGAIFRLRTDLMVTLGVIHAGSSRSPRAHGGDAGPTQAVRASGLRAASRARVFGAQRVGGTAVSRKRLDRLDARRLGLPPAARSLWAPYGRFFCVDGQHALRADLLPVAEPQRPRRERHGLRLVERERLGQPALPPYRRGDQQAADNRRRRHPDRASWDRSALVAPGGRTDARLSTSCRRRTGSSRTARGRGRRRGRFGGLRSSASGPPRAAQRYAPLGPPAEQSRRFARSRLAGLNGGGQPVAARIQA